MQLSRNSDMTRPLVAVTATTKWTDGLPRVRLNEAYVEALRLAGLTPLIVPPLPPDELPDILAAVNGVVLSGGEDVDPRIYGAEPSPLTHPAHAERDRCELALAHLAHERRIATLAICRGAQVVNVAFGGTLVQDIPSECDGALPHDLSEQRAQRVHGVTVEPDSELGRALGADRVSVNSSHHQAIAAPAPGLRVTARSDDGVVEGAEWVRDDWWMVAVQWHPEELVGDTLDWDRRLFHAFAAQVRGATPRAST